MSRDGLFNLIIVMTNDDGDEKTSETRWMCEDDAVDYAQSFHPSGGYIAVAYILNDEEPVSLIKEMR